MIAPHASSKLEIFEAESSLITIRRPRELGEKNDTTLDIFHDILLSSPRRRWFIAIGTGPMRQGITDTEPSK